MNGCHQVSNSIDTFFNNTNEDYKWKLLYYMLLTYNPFYVLTDNDIININNFCNNENNNIRKEKLENDLYYFIGYPLNHSYNYSNVIDYFNYNLNNVGSPYESLILKTETKDLEIKVLEWFSNLWGISFENIFGYITSSGTEGNLQGLYTGRESFDEKPILYTSNQSHYSIFKIAHILDLELCIIDTQENGEMDYKDFIKKLNKNKPVLINANIGTTMLGAIDNTREIYRILQKNNCNYYIHADGALMGFVLPFLEKDLLFRKHINSISISGHKFLGIPFPCGIFIMEKKYLEKISNKIEYVGSIDCTINGSRNGHSALFFNYIINNKGKDEFKKDITKCIELAEYLVEKLSILNAWRNQNSITVILPKLNDILIKKWQLAVEQDICHVVIMPHITKELLDEFVEDVLFNFT